MDWSKNWNERLALPRSQHWSTKVIRATAVAWGAAAGIEAVADGSVGSLGLWTAAGAGALYFGAVIADAVILTARVADEWFEEHLDEIAPGTRHARGDVGVAAPARAQ